MNQTDWIVLGVGAVLLWGLVFVSRQIEYLKDRLAPDDEDDEG